MKTKFCIGIALLLLGCKKDAPVEQLGIRKLHARLGPSYAISECWLNNQKVYDVQHLVYDGASYLYSLEGNRLYTCNYAWGVVDSMCYQVDSCKVVYCPPNNMFNMPAVDEYGLDR